VPACIRRQLADEISGVDRTRSLTVLSVQFGRHRRSVPDSARVARAGFGVSPKQSFQEVREGETPSPARETRALPGNSIAPRQ
jgi:hypothetical protein